MKKDGKNKACRGENGENLRRRVTATVISATPTIYLYSAEMDEMISTPVTLVFTTDTHVQPVT